MTDLTITVNDQPVTGGDLNVVAKFVDEFHVNVRITDEGMILDSYDPEGELLGTVGMTWDEWTDYLKGR